MAVYRVEKSQNYTCMSNHHLRNENLSLKAKGLFSIMLSLPDDWDYSLEGLVKICNSGKHAISSALHELEEEGYVVCRRIRNKKGQLTAYSYTIFEEPQMDHAAPAPEEEKEAPAGSKPAPAAAVPAEPKAAAPVQESSVWEAPKSEKPKFDFPALDNRTQISTDKPSTNKSNTYSENLSISTFCSEDWEEEDGMREEIAAGDSEQVIQRKLRKNIEYQSLIQDPQTDKRRLDSLLGMMADFLCGGSADLYFAGARRSMQQIRERFSQLNIFHIEYVLDCFKRTTKRIFNIRKYMLTSLYNAPTTMDAYYDNRVNHDLYGGKKWL